MIIFRIYDPNTITLGYWDEFGTAYSLPLPSGSIVQEKPFTLAQAIRELVHSAIYFCTSVTGLSCRTQD